MTPVLKLEIAEAAMHSTEALVVNQAAWMAGQIFVEARREAADKESRRKEYQLTLRDEHMQAGANKTNADDLARSDTRYIAYLDEIKRLEERRDRAEILWKVLHQRGYALIRGGAPLEVV